MKKKLLKALTKVINVVSELKIISVLVLKNDKQCSAIFMILVIHIERFFLMAAPDCGSIAQKRHPHSCLGFNVQSHYERSAPSNDRLSVYDHVTMPAHIAIPRLEPCCLL